MNIYLVNIIAVIILGIIQENNKQVLVVNKRHYKVGTFLTLSTVFILMTIEMGLRGDFAIDTINYYSIFKSNLNSLSHSSVTSTRDIGFYYIFMGVLQKLSKSYLFFLIVIALIISYSYTRFLKQYSEMFWLSALLLFCGGSFYTGFNIMRQVFAASLIALSYTYIFQKNFQKFCLVIVLISTIHFSAVVMIPVYFMLTHEWNFKKNRYVKVTAVVLLCGFLYVMTPNIFKFVSQYVYSQYGLASAFGVSEGIGIWGTLKAIILSGGIIINSKYFDKNNAKDLVVYNGCILYLIIAVCGANIFIIQRLTHYFVPCLLIAYPHILCRIQNKSNRRMLIAATVVLFILSGINVVFDSNYYFYWDNKTVHWG